MKKALMYLSAMRREICIWLGCVVLVGIILFPPWRGSLTATSDYPGKTMDLYHSPLWRPPQIWRAWSVTPDYSRMVIEIVAAEAIVLALYMTWGRREN